MVKRYHAMRCKLLVESTGGYEQGVVNIVVQCFAYRPLMPQRARAFANALANAPNRSHRCLGVGHCAK